MLLFNTISQHDPQPNNRQQLQLIDWFKIFLRLIKSEQTQKFNIVQAFFAMRKYGLLLLILQKYPNIRIVPNQEIDAVLHAHMANMEQFTKDCQKLFQTSLCHIPEFGMRDDEERLEWQLLFAQTQALFELNFGQGAMGNSPPACCEILLA